MNCVNVSGIIGVQSSKGEIETKDCKLVEYATCSKCRRNKECQVIGRNGCRDFVPINGEEFLSFVLEDLKNTVKNNNYTSDKRVVSKDAFDSIVADAALCIKRGRAAYLFTFDQLCHLFEWQRVDVDSVNVYWDMKDGIFTIYSKGRRRRTSGIERNCY